MPSLPPNEIQQVILTWKLHAGERREVKRNVLQKHTWLLRKQPRKGFKLPPRAPGRNAVFRGFNLLSPADGSWACFPALLSHPHPPPSLSLALETRGVSTLMSGLGPGLPLSQRSRPRAERPLWAKGQPMTAAGPGDPAPRDHDR